MIINTIQARDHRKITEKLSFRQKKSQKDYRFWSKGIFFVGQTNLIKF